MNLRVSLFGQKDVGRIREKNQDDFIICQDLEKQDWQFNASKSLIPGELGCLLAVADGMGGAKAGEIASDLAIKSTMRYFGRLESVPENPNEVMLAAIQEAHNVILRYTEMRPETEGMGTTIVLGWLIQDHVYVAWCGDSRAYLFRKNQSFLPLTEDHSLVWEMVKSGQLTPEEARLHPDSNIITQSLGSQQAPPKPQVLANPISIQSGDRILLCSDGLNGMVPDRDIEAIIQGELSLEKCGNRLIDAANEAGGQDNITVVLLEVQASGPALKEMASPIIQHAPSKKRSSLQSWLPSLALLFALMGLVGAVWFKLKKSPPAIVVQQESNSIPPQDTASNLPDPAPDSEPSVQQHPASPPVSSPPQEQQADPSIPASSPEQSPAQASPEIQQKVANIRSSIRRLTQADRINILLLYKPLEEAQFNRLQHIQQRTNPNHRNSIAQELTTFLNLPATSTQGIQIKNANMQAAMDQLAKLEQELRGYEAFLSQLEQ